MYALLLTAMEADENIKTTTIKDAIPATVTEESYNVKINQRPSPRQMHPSSSEKPHASSKGRSSQVYPTNLPGKMYSITFYLTFQNS